MKRLPEHSSTKTDAGARVIQLRLIMVMAQQIGSIRTVAPFKSKGSVRADRRLVMAVDQGESLSHAAPAEDV
ncbi:MAG: hypothetical protein WBS14_08465 [Rhodomicrobium sp.]